MDSSLCLIILISIKIIGGLKTWSNPKQTGLAPAPRQYHSATLITDKLVIYGGSEEGGKEVEDVYVLNTSM